MPLEMLKTYFLKHFEQSFVLVILLSVAAINYFIPYKLAFLNFYFIPLLLAAYYLDIRRALLGAVFCVLMVVIYAYLDPDSFIPGSTWLDLSMNIVTWASFLFLTGATVGILNNKLKQEIKHAKGLNEDLSKSRESLEKAQAELKEYAKNLESKVAERTEGLEKSKTAVEELKQKVENALYSTMDASVVKLIIENRLRTEKRRVSVLFSDLKDFTVYSEERGPEVVITELNKYLEEMENVLLDYHAHIDKYMGDGIMAEFGAPVSFDRHALLAVAGGLKMQERLRAKSFEWQMRIGIATGEPIIGLIGHRRQSYSAIGDVVNAAARIEALCAPGKVTIDEATYEEVKQFIVARRKTTFAFAQSQDPAFSKSVAELTQALDDAPDNVDLLKKAGFLLHQFNQPIEAHEYFKRALELDPHDDRVKLAFAEVAMKLPHAESVAVKGKKTRLHLYEVTGLKDPLRDRSKIPQHLYDSCAAKILTLAPYPEDQILPVECLDGSVGHGRVVGFLSCAIAEKLGLADSEKRDILTAGYLSDIGKAVIPTHLLNRPGGVSKEEHKEVMKHPEESVRMLKTMGYEKDALFEIIGAHHEHYGGGGYPRGLSGESILLGGRILAVADAYDSMTSWRPWQDRWEHRAAYAEMKKAARKGQFDPKILSVLGELLGIS